MTPKAQPLEIDLRFEEDGAQIFAGALDTAAAHQICPYSNATRGNVDVGLTLA